MTKIWLKKLIEKLNKSDGVSIMAIVVLMLIMTIMGGVFTSVMGRWKISAPLTMHSNSALQLANTAAAFALQEASFKFYNKDANGILNFNYGTKAAPYPAFNDGNGGTGEYWFELPGVNDDDLIGADADVVDDDGDDANPNLYTIVATGSVDIGGTTVAKRQIKVFTDITDSNVNPLPPGIHVTGNLRGTGVAGLNMRKDGSVIDDVAFGPQNYPDSNSAPASGSRDDIVYQPPGNAPPVIEGDIFEAIAIYQGHYFSGNCAPGMNYPNGSYYFDPVLATMPNIIYVKGDLNVNSQCCLRYVLYRGKCIVKW